MNRKVMILFLIGIFISSAGLISSQGLISPISNINSFTGNLTNFLQLNDTFSSYTGKGGLCLIVNPGETGVSYTACDDSLWELNSNNIMPVTFGRDLDMTDGDIFADKIGLGTTNPQNTIHVIGDGNFTTRVSTPEILFPNGDSITSNSSVLITVGGQQRLLLGELSSTFNGDVNNVDDIDDWSRFSETNNNNGTEAVAGFRAKNADMDEIRIGITSRGYDTGNPFLVGGQGGIFLDSNSKMGFSIGYNQGYIWRNDPNDSGLHRNTTNVLMALSGDGNLNIGDLFSFNSSTGRQGIGNFSDNPPFFNVSFAGEGIHIKNDDPTLLLDQEGGSMIGLEAGISAQYILSSHDRLGGKTTLYRIANDGTHLFDSTAKINISAQRFELGDVSIGDTSSIDLLGANGLQESTMIGFWEDSRENNGVQLHYDSADNELHFMDWTSGIVDATPIMTIKRNNDEVEVDRLEITTLSGIGNDYACLDSGGNLFRSDAPC